MDLKKSEVIAYSIKNTEFLLSQGVKIIVVACNTATTIAIDTLRKEFPNISFIGVEPAIKPASALSNNKRIAVLATYNTLRSKEFESSLNKPYMNNIKVFPIVGTRLVELIENDKLYSLEMQNLVQKYTAKMIAEDIDYLVLGCTHYPYIKSQLQAALPPHIKIIDSGEAIAKQTEIILRTNLRLNNSNDTAQHLFYYNHSEKGIHNFVPQEDNIKLIYRVF